MRTSHARAYCIQGGKCGRLRESDSAGPSGQMGRLIRMFAPSKRRGLPPALPSPPPCSDRAAAAVQCVLLPRTPSRPAPPRALPATVRRRLWRHRATRATPPSPNGKDLPNAAIPDPSMRVCTGRGQRSARRGSLLSLSHAGGRAVFATRLRFVRFFEREPSFPAVRASRSRTANRRVLCWASAVPCGCLFSSVACNRNIGGRYYVARYTGDTLKRKSNNRRHGPLRMIFTAFKIRSKIEIL